MRVRVSCMAPARVSIPGERRPPRAAFRLSACAMIPTMDETTATATTQPGAQPESAPGETLVLTVDDAAHLIGVTPQAVRKRIAKGTLAAYREGRAWRVVLNHGPSATDETETPQPWTQPPLSGSGHGRTKPSVSVIDFGLRSTLRRSSRMPLARHQHPSLRQRRRRWDPIPRSRGGGDGGSGGRDQG